MNELTEQREHQSFEQEHFRLLVVFHFQFEETNYNNWADFLPSDCGRET